MLREDQAAELLRRCEVVAGQRLNQTRGNLRTAENRSSAIWELICIDAFSEVGELTHEPDHRSRPDVVLAFPNADDVWIEVAYLYPRYWKSDSRTRELRKWIYQEAEASGIPQFQVSVHIEGLSGKSTGPVSALPDQHEKNLVRRLGAFRQFFSRIAEKPDESFQCQLSPYTVKLAYDAKAPGPYVSGSGVVEESPTDVREHALFRVLGEKRKQHNPPCPYVVCVGSDQSPALSRFGRSHSASELDAIREFFRVGSRISAVVVVSIETSTSMSNGLDRIAYSRVYENPNATTPLVLAHIEALKRADFNRWKYDFLQPRAPIGKSDSFRRSAGPLSMKLGKEQVLLTVPATVLIDCLAGRTALKEQYVESSGVKLLACIEDGWDIVDCLFEPQKIEEGLSGRVTLTLVPPPERVFRD